MNTTGTTIDAQLLELTKKRLDQFESLFRKTGRDGSTCAVTAFKMVPYATSPITVSYEAVVEVTSGGKSREYSCSGLSFGLEYPEVLREFIREKDSSLQILASWLYT